MIYFFENACKCIRVATFATIMLVSLRTYAHDWPVHRAITESAYQSSSDLQAFLNENLKTPNSTSLAMEQLQCPATLMAIEWLKEGSTMEDEQTYGIIFGAARGPRPLDHFYTVTPVRTSGQVFGITDGSEGPLAYKDTGFGIYSLGGGFITNSFAWASKPGIQGPSLNIAFRPLIKVGTNSFNWPCARTYELGSLTNSSPLYRNANMANMFYALGHILHLNQDLSQPDHTRNDNHNYERGAFIENFGNKHFQQNPQWFIPPPHDVQGWAYWQSQGFSKLLDFWDRNEYIGSTDSKGLSDDADGTSGKKLGLAEFSNGNFLGERALYKEVYKSWDKHYFPFPSKSSTDFPGNPEIVTFANGKTHNVITKTKDGVTGFRLSVLNYLGAKFPSVPTSHNTTLNDDGVLQDYHSLLLPKAVEYSTGILDYFFRGSMEISIIGYDAASMQYTNLVVNTSGQDFKDGSFSIFNDDTNKFRTMILQTNWIGILSNGANLTLTFTNTLLSPTNKLLLVYQGTIGVSNGAALDSVDAHIGIAAKNFSQSDMVAWWPGDGNVNDVIAGNNGTLINGAGYAPGVVGEAFSFNGFDQYAKATNSLALNSLGHQITIEFWVNANFDNAMTNFQGLVTSDFYGIEISYGTTIGTFGINFFISTDSGIEFSHTSDANGGGAVISAGQWHHIAGTYDSSKLQLYIDGQPWGNPQHCSGAISRMYADSFISIGTEDGRTSADLSNRYFNGLVDEVSIYNHGLSANEIQDIYNAGSAGKLSYQWR